HPNPEDAATQGAESAPEAATPSVNASAELEALRAERDRLKDGLLRALADLDDYRKRARRDSDESVRKAREGVLRALLPVFDNLDRAGQYSQTGADSQAGGKGVEMVLRLFEDTLTKVGGKRVRAAGQPFDPSQHDATAQIESAEHPAGTVAREELP